MKDTAKRRGAATPDARPYRTLAEAISFVLKHPDTPESIYNALGEAVTSIQSDIDHDTPEMVEMALASYAGA